MWGTTTDRSIVVVDDDRGCRELHRHWLESDYAVQTAASGEAAIDLVDAETDLVLLDREMPGLNGKAVLGRLRDRGYDGYVVMVTGVKPDFDLVDLAVDDYLVKPISERELTQVVERLWARADCHDQLRELFALARKKARLEIETDPRDRARSEQFQDLRGELRRKRAALAERVEGTGASWRAAFEACEATAERAPRQT